MKGKKQNEVALREEFMPQAALQQIESLAEKLKDSKALPSTITNGAQLMMVMMAGYEAGMTPVESINSYYIVNGKITIWGQAVLSQVKRAGFKVKWNESTSEVATVTLTDFNGENHVETYTIKDASLAGLLTKDPWKKYPKDMLRWKALGRAVRFFCPEALGGHYIKEDIEDGEFVDAIPSNASPKPTISVDAIATAHVEKKEEAGLSEEGHRAISDAWLELADLEKWGAHDTDVRLGKTLKKYYGKERGSDLTEDEAKDFVGRLQETIKKKQLAIVDAIPEDKPATPGEVVSALGGKLPIACPLCKVEYTDFDAEMGNVKAVENIGMCNPCSTK